MFDLIDDVVLFYNSIYGGKMADLKKEGAHVPEVRKEDPAGDFVTTNTGEKVYDVGESVVTKMNRTHGIFDKDLFFQDLFENYLICVERREPRQRPNSGIITYWDHSTSFEDFLSDALENLDHQIQSLKFAKSINQQKVHALDESFLAEAKIDKGSAEVGKKFGVEDFDALYEIMSKSKETIKDYLANRLTMSINQNTGRVRVTSAAV